MTDQLVTIDPEVILGRQALIAQDAPCVGCGETLAACQSRRGKDPTAPPWLGCCARGTGMAPCTHRSDPAALATLVAEIASGSVRSADDIRAERAARAAARADAAKGPIGPGIRARLEQGVWWRSKDGQWHRIADMNEGHRRNTAAMLLRNAAAYEFQYSIAELLFLGEDVPGLAEEAIAEGQAERMKNPARWMRSTPLYRALLDGLPKVA